MITLPKVYILNKLFKIKMDWKTLQENSDDILAQGILKLKNQESKNWDSISSQNYGNYLICENEINWYIGEGKNISKRLKQQFNEKLSTFYKTYKKDFGNNKIESFKVKYIETKIGRKEIEEFGIVNLPTSLNKFQKNKCKKFELENNSKFNWDSIQNSFETLLIDGEKTFFQQNSKNWVEAIAPNNAGVYMVFNNNKIIYIGETSSLIERYNTHSGTTYFSALRRHIGKTLLKFNFVQIKVKNKKNREFLEKDDLEVTNFLKSCTVKFLPINFGRFELEEFLIRKHHPILNKKDNK